MFHLLFTINKIDLVTAAMSKLKWEYKNIEGHRPGLLLVGPNAPVISFYL